MGMRLRVRFRTLLIVGLLALLAGCGSASVPTTTVVRASAPRATPSVSRADAAALRNDNALFAGRLLAAVARTQPNVALSPASISQALSMAFAGARGPTALQVAAALHFTLPAARLGAAFNGVDRSLANVNGPDTTLEVANALYGQTGQQFRRAFLNVLARDYGAGLRTADFEHATEAARAAINAWVSAQTRAKIPTLLEPGDVDPSTKLVLVNAVYLKAKWLEPFEHQNTVPATFHAPGAAEKVPAMHQTGTFRYKQGDGYQALELGYRGGRLAFDILLPTIGQLQPMLSSLASRGPLALLAGLRPTQAAVALPKFRLRTHFELADPLQKLGMRLAFEPGTADLSGIAGKPGDLSVKAVVHEAYLSVDEDGTEAAAATGVTVVATGALAPPPVDFVVDRPFVFVLRDTRTGAVLFTGVVSRP